MPAPGEANKEMRAHESSYALFTSMMKWGTIASLLTGAIVVLIIAS